MKKKVFVHCDIHACFIVNGCPKVHTVMCYSICRPSSPSGIQFQTPRKLLTTQEVSQLSVCTVSVVLTLLEFHSCPHLLYICTYVCTCLLLPQGAELPECKVKITFKGENEEQMSVTEGEYVVVIREDPSGGWW